MNFEHLDGNNLKIRSVVEGEGPLVVLVHGWPESWYSWRHQIKPLTKACFKVAAIDVSCLLYTSPSPRDATLSRMPSSA